MGKQKTEVRGQKSKVNWEMMREKRCGMGDED
jgi:hypothetical protein